MDKNKLKLSRKDSYSNKKIKNKDNRDWRKVEWIMVRRLMELLFPKQLDL